MRSLFEGEGIRFVLEQAKSARKDGSSIVIAAEHQEVRGDLLLIAAGRKPSVDGLCLEKAGVHYSARGITIDDHLRTNIKNNYAAGHVAGGDHFHHSAALHAF